MKVTVTVGEVHVKFTDVDVTVTQIKSLMRHAASIALALPTPPVAVEYEEKYAPIGFTANLERAEALPFEEFFTDDEE